MKPTIVTARTISIVTAALSIAFGAVAHASPPPRYGVIEIGAKGVKSYSFDLDRADHNCAPGEDAYLKCLDPQTLASINVNPIDDPGFKETTKAVERVASELGTKGIPADHVYAVISSSVMEKQGVGDALAAVLQKGLKRPIDKITADQEAIFGVRGALGLLPDNVRSLRTTQAALVDIGSGNIKGAYVNTDGKSELTFDVSYGTKTAVSAIEKQRGGDTFGAAADKWRTSVLVPALRVELDRKQGVTNRNRVYLIGGIVWALATLTHPDDKQEFMPLDPKTIDETLAKASATDGGLCADDRKRAYKAVANVCETFSPSQMIAGFQLLKGLSEELNFVKAQKHIFFFRPLYVWPLGYVRLKLDRK